MDYIIGIDAGGTKTTASAFALDGSLLKEVVTGFGNLTVDFSKGMENIKAAINQLIGADETADMKLLRIVLGCAGIETGDKKELAKTALEESYQALIYVTNDAMLALFAALKGEDGILIIAGTGSIGYLKQGDSLKRFGGWGHLINDDGSGYSIVIKAIRYIAYSFDTNNNSTPLTKAIFKALGISELKQLIEFTYKSTKGEIAALVPVVEQTANDGDYQARSILSWAGERLAYLVIGLCHQYNVIKPHIALSGSVIRKTALVKESFCETLNSELNGYTIFDQPIIPTMGAIYLAANDSNEK